MSIEAMAIVANMDVRDAGAKLLLIGLANHHNPSNGMCFPSVATLERYISQSRKTVFRKLLKLETLGLIKRHPVYDTNGRQMANRYELLFMRKMAETWGCHFDTPPSKAKGGEGVNVDTGEGVTADTPIMNLNKEGYKEGKKVVGAKLVSKRTKGSVVNAAPTTTTRDDFQRVERPTPPPSFRAEQPTQRRRQGAMDFDGHADERAAQIGAERATDAEMLRLYNLAAEKLGMRQAAMLTEQRRQMLRALRNHRGEDGELSPIARNWRRILAELLPSAQFTKWRPANFHQVMQVQFWVELLEGQHAAPAPVIEESQEIRRARAHAKIWAGWVRDGKTKLWPATWGPAPGKVGCEIPAAIFGEYSLDAAGKPLSESGNVPSSGVILHDKRVA